MQIYLFIAAIALYVLCAALPARRGGLISVVTLAAWLLHGAGLWSEVAAAGSLRLGFASMLSSALWVSVAAYWVENQNFSLDGLRRLVMPSAAVATALQAIFPGNLVAMGDKSPLFGWHIAIATMAYSTLTIAAFHAVLMALQESRLHSGTDRKTFLSGALDQLPALLTMEKLLFRMIGFGFALLTLTVLSGIVFSEALFGQALKWDHKSVFTLLSWVLFASLLAGRRFRGWRGKTALSFTLAGFATLLLAYVGSRFVFEVVLHKGWA
ncbi:cytochrome C assembly family protein [Duganella aceris]|jgi:ABC-type uncharacterized transport system permease subunit|uniref:Cytochrome c biogenesis protein CcsA n=1 Tax=Duganella aceris TaxID=2703883 RepID=A0ABX0FBF1_9BURK|nr:cytochrome c biogenesis protein CcsA [Duganella aceris]NGZ82651.1 cytochrome c biogenesis protein CcsA [Duganella aceris]